MKVTKKFGLFFTKLGNRLDKWFNPFASDKPSSIFAAMFRLMLVLAAIGYIGKHYSPVHVKLTSLDQNKIVALESSNDWFGRHRSFTFLVPDSVAYKIELDFYEAKILCKKIEEVNFRIPDVKNPSLDLKSYWIKYQSESFFNPNVRLSEKFLESRKKYKRNR